MGFRKDLYWDWRYLINEQESGFSTELARFVEYLPIVDDSKIETVL